MQAQNKFETPMTDYLLGLKEIIGDKASGTKGIVPVSRSKWWSGIKTGLFPAPIKLGRRSLWRYTEIMALISHKS